MSNKQKVNFWRSMILVCLIILLGCAYVSKALDPSISEPQVIVNPETIRLGVAKLMGTNITFEGVGFKPGDSVFITLIAPNRLEAIVAEGPIKPDGTFKAEVSKLTKAMEILKADIEFNEKFKEIIVITQPPIPVGVYRVKVTSMLSDKTAETKLNVKGPTVINTLTDWLGKLTGKIRYKEKK